MTTTKAAFTAESDRVAVTGKIDPEKMKLFVDIERKAEGVVTREELLGLIEKSVPNDLIDYGVIDDIVKHVNAGEKVTDRRVAKGHPAEPGHDGKVLFLVKQFSEKGDREVKVDEKGFANYFELQLFDNIEKGRAVARLYPPKAGKDGRDVTGAKVVSKPGKPAQVSVDKTLRIAKDSGKDGFDTIFSEAEGFLLDDHGKLTIQEELVIKNDLDFHYGNIDFIGRVKVMGDVRPGFSIKARKGIDINGAVQGGAVLVSPEGDINVKGFLFGGENSRVVTGANLTVSVAQEMNAEVRGTVNIKKQVLDCMIRCGRSVHLPEGSVVGGEVFSVCGMEGKLIGNEVGKPTAITLSSSVEATAEYATLQEQIKAHENATVLLKSHLGPLAENPSRIQLLKDPHKSKMEQMLRKLKVVEEGKVKLYGKREELLKSSIRSGTCRVNILKKMYPGVTIKSGDIKYVSSDEVPGPKSITLDPEKGEFVISDLLPLQCDIPPIESVDSKKKG